MCGIFTLLNNHNHIPQSIIQSCFQNGKGRGPENSSLWGARAVHRHQVTQRNSRN